MGRADIYNDTNGAVYITAETRYKLFWFSKAFGKDRREIRYNHDLKCYALKLQNNTEKEALKRLLSQNKWQRRVDGCGNYQESNKGYNSSRLGKHRKRTRKLL